jgi:hypothetical protein
MGDEPGAWVDEEFEALDFSDYAHRDGRELPAPCSVLAVASPTLSQCEIERNTADPAPSGRRACVPSFTLGQNLARLQN